MSGRSKHGAAKQGPYDENNPAPPPPGPPPSSTGRGEQSKDREYATPYKRLNSRQRKKLRDDAARTGPQGHLVSDATTKNMRQSSEKSRVEERFQEDEREENTGDRRGTHVRRRKSLQDARKYTPDQIMDETPGRLSPENWQDDPMSARQGDWSETFQPGHDLDDGQTYGRSWQGSPYGRQWEPVGQENRRSYRSNSREQQHSWPRRSDSASRTPERRPSQPYGFDDEVDWDDGEAFNLPSKKESSKKRSAPATKHQHMGPGNPDPYVSGKGTKRPTSPPHPATQRKQKRQAREDKAVHEQQASQPRWASKPKGATSLHPANKSHETPAHSKKNFGDKKLKDPLLEDDPALVGRPARQAPDTAYDLREYDHYIYKMHQKLPKYQAYRHANGKVGWHQYGASKKQELGLCFATFCTPDRCELGVKCAWRHHPLTKAEREWILSSGDPRARNFLENLSKYWAVPEVPVPGASMQDK